ncbi:MAG: hypothetical protein CFE23_03285 [Flavobacterium sp. BFFFF1]|uniref:hypothetical protein n=1 Tax=unclassified Flavobacterium TaxID=196869 RepID=UPI000BCBC735|nr:MULTISPECIES: hypothetical protein [unclassified Flavobacterium]OYU81503.1 MAG: hypothetical protein CFE23_03285 [Flavobacterium sp. BFFFF1]
MKFHYKKFLLSMLMLTVSFATFAQIPDPDSDPGSGGNDPTPINTKLIWLAILGVVFAFYQISANKRRQKA